MEDAENETNGKQLSTCEMGCEDNQVQSGAEPVRMSVCAFLKIARPGKNSMVKEMFVVRAEEGEASHKSIKGRAFQAEGTANMKL